MMLALVLAAHAGTLEDAVRAELSRAAAMSFGDAPAPYLVAYDVIEGRVTDCFSENGARIRESTGPHRELRSEVRIGDYKVDSSNISILGAQDPVDNRLLPIENVQIALRRELWLSTDLVYKAAIEALSQKRSFRGGQPPRTYDDMARITVTKAPYNAPAAPALPATLCATMDRLSATVGANIEIGQAVARDWQGARYTATSEGMDAWRNGGYAVIRLEGTTTLPDGSTAVDARSFIARDTAGLPAEPALMSAAAEVAKWLSAQATAATEKEYLGPVIFEGQAATELFSQLLAAEITGTPPEDADPEDEGMFGGTPVGRLGRRLLPTGWTVVDDVSLAPDTAAAYTLDHEGVAPRRVELVKDGVVQDLLMSRMPSKDRAESTGHGRAMGTSRRTAVPAVVSVTAPKLVSAQKLRRQALRLAADTGRDWVLLVRHLTPPALHDTFSIVMTGEGPGPGLGAPYELVRLYADGREEPLRPMDFVGVDRRLLRDIVAASAGVGFVQTLDGPPGPARYQTGPTGGLAQAWSVPTVLVTEVELTARSAGEPRVLPVK